MFLWEEQMAQSLSGGSLKNAKKCLKFLWKGLGFSAIVWQQLVFRRARSWGEPGAAKLSVLELQTENCKDSFYLLGCFRLTSFALG